MNTLKLGQITALAVIVSFGMSFNLGAGEHAGKEHAGKKVTASSEHAGKEHAGKAITISAKDIKAEIKRHIKKEKKKNKKK